MITLILAVLLVFGILVYNIIRYIGLVNSVERRSGDNRSDNVVCSPDDVLDAWIQDLPDRRGCPEWTNNYIIGEDYQMYEKNFSVDGGCCYYSNKVRERHLFPNPWICIMNTDHTPFSVAVLNEKPYSYTGDKLNFFVPACGPGTNCVEMKRVGVDSSTGNGRYKIYNIDEKITETLVITLSGGCAQIERIMDGDEVVAERVDGKLVVHRHTDLIDLITTGRFYPIAGANLAV